MTRRFTFALVSAALLGFIPVAGPAAAQNCSPYNYTLTNGNTADASQVQGNFNTIMTCANTYLAHNGANSDITSLNALATPLSKAQGGTGNTTGQPSGAAGGNLSGSFPNPTVTSTSLTAPLPVSQGGSGKSYFSMPGGSEFSIASASTTDLGTATSNGVVVTGSSSISSFGSSASTSNPYYFLRFTGNVTLVYNATNMLLNSGGNNYSTSVGDVAIAQYLGSGSWKVSIIPVSGNAVVGGPQAIYIAGISGSSAVNVDFGGGPVSYRSYEILVFGFGPQTNNTQLYVNFRAGGQAISGTGAYQWVETRYYPGGGTADGSSSDTKFAPGGTTANWSSSYKANSLKIHLFPNLAGDDGTAEYDLNYMNSTPLISVVRGSVYCGGNGQGPIGGVQLSFTSGNFNGGVIEVFGYP